MNDNFVLFEYDGTFMPYENNYDNNDNNDNNKNNIDINLTQPQTIFYTHIEITLTPRYYLRYFRKKQKQKDKMKQKDKIEKNYIYSNIHNFHEQNACVLNNIGYTSNLTKDTPFIKYLINKRINFCRLGSSSHIAAFIPVSSNFGTFFCQTSNTNAILGENSDKPLYSGSKIKTHAEMDALNKVKGLLRCKKVKKNRMNLIVLRINKIGDLCESAPCFHCTKELEENEFVQVDKLYYSRCDGSITCVKFDKWASSGNSHVSKGWKWLQRTNKIS